MDKKELIKNLTNVIKSGESNLSKQDLKTLKQIRKELRASESKEEVATVVLRLIKFFELAREIVTLLVDNFKEPPS